MYSWTGHLVETPVQWTQGILNVIYRNIRSEQRFVTRTNKHFSTESVDLFI